MHHELVFVDQPFLHQALGKAGAAMRQDVLARLLFQARDFLSQVAGQDGVSAQSLVTASEAGVGLMPCWIFFRVASSKALVSSAF